MADAGRPQQANLSPTGSYIRSPEEETGSAAKSAVCEYRSRALGAQAAPVISSNEAISGEDNNDANSTETSVYAEIGSPLALSYSPAVLR